MVINECREIDIVCEAGDYSPIGDAPPKQLGMNNRNHKGWIPVAVVFLVLLVDQLSKIWVKTQMALYDAIHITDWFQIYFV